MAVASHKYASTILLIVLLTAPFICILTCGLVIPTLCPMVRRSTPCRATMVKSCTVNNQNVSDGFYGRSLLTSFSGSVGDTGAIMELDEGGRPPLEASFYEENFFDKFMLNFFRGLLQNEIGYVSPLEGFGGLIDEAQNYYVKQGASPEEMQNMVVRLLTAISGPMLPLLYRILIAPGPWAPLATALVTPYILKFLVGPSTVAPRRDGKLGGVHVKRCKFLEATGCKGLCMNMCKLPVEQFFQESLGLNMTMSPNFDTYECSLSFGLEPFPVESDPDIPVGCLKGCSCKKLKERVITACIK